METDMSLQEQVNDYLDALRDSGATNMFGAAPYLVEEFGVTRHEAKNLLFTWMQTFAERNPQ
jgi:isocitrate dehydrogenase kinase/phosphatase